MGDSLSTRKSTGYGSAVKGPLWQQLADGTFAQLTNSSGELVGSPTLPAGGIGTAELANSAVTTAKIADTSITPAKIAETQSVTSTADGTGSGAITSLTGFKKFVTVTSASATNQVSLPGVTASTIGQEIFLTVGSNGYELITPASSNTTINQVDSDGTNQLDVAANTTLWCVQVSSTGWLAVQIAAAAITVVAPDND